MHEISIANSLIELACDVAESHHASRIDRLHIQVGALSGVVADALRFSFELAAEGTLCEGAILEIECVPVVVHCPECDESKTLSNAYCFACPDCGCATADIRAGRELDLISVELKDHETARA